MSKKIGAIAEYLFSILKFKNLKFIPIVGIVGIYGLGSLIALLVFDDVAVIQLFGILVCGLVVYFLSYKYLGKHLTFNFFLKFRGKIHIETDVWVCIISLLYFGLILYAVVSAPKVALFEALKGANASDISIARQMLFVSRSGVESGLVYANALLSSIFLPYTIALVYIEKKKYRHIFLTAFVLTLLLSLEKALAIKAFLPLIILAINGNIPKRSAYIFTGILLSLILGVTSLSKMGNIGTGVAERGVLSQSLSGAGTGKAKNPFALGVQLKNRFELVDPGTLPGYIVNRILWIPYVTAYDWLLYFDRSLQSEYLTGRTSLTISLLTGQKKFNMSGAVFAAEYGSDGTLNTGSSNTIFLVDMFVNFGWLGVAVVSFLLMLILKIFEFLKDPAATACFYYFLYQLMIGSFFGVMFSDGGFLFLCMVLFVSISSREKSRHQSFNPI